MNEINLKKGIEYSIIIFFVTLIVIAIIVLISRKIFHMEIDFINTWNRILIAAVVGLILGFAAALTGKLNSEK